MKANAELKLKFAKKSTGNSYLQRQFFKLPLQVFPVSENESDGTAFLYLLNPSGGMLEDDFFDLDFNLCEGSSVVITTPSSNKIYKTTDKPARQFLNVNLDKNSVLEYLPEPSVLYKNSKYEQSNIFKIAKNATLFTWDSIISGRIMNGECYDFTSLSMKNEFYYNDKLLLKENSFIEPKTNIFKNLGILNDYKIFSTCYLVTENITEKLLDELKELSSNSILIANSMPCKNILVIKLLADEFEELNEVLLCIWNIVRKNVLNKNSFRIRKY